MTPKQLRRTIEIAQAQQQLPDSRRMPNSGRLSRVLRGMEGRQHEAGDDEQSAASP
jgi:hypothetical protein